MSGNNYNALVKNMPGGGDMPWAAALAMAILYLYNMPVAAAFVWNERGHGFAAYPFSPAAALRAARRHACREKKSAGKKKRKKEKGGPSNRWVLTP